MALIALVSENDADWNQVGNDRKHVIRKLILEELLKLPRSLTTDSATQHSSLLESHVIDTSGKVSLMRMLNTRGRLQSGTTTKSERIVKINPKFEIAAICDTQEASHRLRIAQDAALGSSLSTTTAKKPRELLWQAAVKQLCSIVKDTELPNLVVKNVNGVNPLKPGCFVIARTDKRTYIGEVLDIFKKAASSRYGSIESASAVAGISFLSLRVFLPLVTDVNEHDDDAMDSDNDSASGASAPLFSCRPNTSSAYQLHTHSPVEHLLYNLGRSALIRHGESSNYTLTPAGAKRWITLNKPRVQGVLPKIRIPGGRMVQKSN